MQPYPFYKAVLDLNDPELDLPPSTCLVFDCKTGRKYCKIEDDTGFFWIAGK